MTVALCATGCVCYAAGVVVLSFIVCSRCESDTAGEHFSSFLYSLYWLAFHCMHTHTHTHLSEYILHLPWPLEYHCYYDTFTHHVYLCEFHRCTLVHCTYIYTNCASECVYIYMYCTCTTQYIALLNVSLSLSSQFLTQHLARAPFPSHAHWAELRNGVRDHAVRGGSGRRAHVQHMWPGPGGTNPDPQVRTLLLRIMHQRMAETTPCVPQRSQPSVPNGGPDAAATDTAQLALPSQDLVREQGVWVHRCGEVGPAASTFR